MNSRRTDQPGAAGRIEVLRDRAAPKTPRGIGGDRPSASAVRRHHGQQGGADAGARLRASWVDARCASTSAASAPAKACTTRGGARLDDMLAVIAPARARRPAGDRRFLVRRLRRERCRRQRSGPRVHARADRAGRHRRLAQFEVPPLPAEAHERALVIHGEARRHRAAVRRDGLGAAAVTSGHGGARGRPFLSRTIAAAQEPRRAPSARGSLKPRSLSVSPIEMNRCVALPRLRARRRSVA